VQRTLPRHAATLRSHRVARAIALGLTGLLAFVASGALAAYIDLRSQIGVSDVDSLLGETRERPPAVAAEQDPSDPFAGQALNILVMGTDLRDAANAELAGEGDEFHSDTTVLVHVAGNRKWVEVVSIPRDSLVDIPECPRSDGSTSPAQSNAMFNTAFALGGGPDRDITGAAACTILTVEALTGIGVTDHMVVEMAGVIDVVDAIGGVTMCIPEPVHGERVDLDLEAGRQKLDGHESINFLRARKGTGMGLELGSDLERIKRQQAFIDSTMREILSQNIITDSPRLYRMVRSILKSISTNPELADPTALAGLAWSVRNLDPNRITFTSVPVVDSLSEPGRVEWTAEADEIWERVAADKAPPGSAPRKGSGNKSPGQSDEPTDGTTGEPTDEPTSSPEPSPSPSLLPGVCG
jgi:LCP family protein required for cell wall assembly